MERISWTEKHPKGIGNFGFSKLDGRQPMWIGLLLEELDAAGHEVLWPPIFVEDEGTVLYFRKGTTTTDKS